MASGSRRGRDRRRTEYTLESIISQADPSNQFARDLTHLPGEQTIESETPKITLLKTSLPQRIHVGHIHILYGPFSDEARGVYAYINCDDTPINIEGVRFCLADNTIISSTAILKASLFHPFSAVISSEPDDEAVSKRLRTLVLYYFLAKGHAQSIAATKADMASFKSACLLVARVDESSKEADTPSVIPMQAYQAAQKHSLRAGGGEAGGRQKKTRFWRDEEEAESADQLKDEDGFAEYQKLMQTIRKHIHTAVEALKAEMDDARPDPNLANTREEQLKSDNEALQEQKNSAEAARDKLEKEVEELKAQNEELLALKQKMQDLFQEKK